MKAGPRRKLGLTKLPGMSTVLHVACTLVHLLIVYSQRYGRTMETEEYDYQLEWTGRNGSEHLRTPMTLCYLLTHQKS